MAVCLCHCSRHCCIGYYCIWSVQEDEDEKLSWRVDAEVTAVREEAAQHAAGLSAQLEAARQQAARLQQEADGGSKGCVIIGLPLFLAGT